MMAEPLSIHLTDKQHAALVLIAKGLTDAEAAEVLGISPRTMKQYSDLLRGKLGVSKRRLLGDRARTLGLV